MDECKPLVAGPAFEKYLPYVIPMLQSATQLSLTTPKVGRCRLNR